MTDEELAALDARYRANQSPENLAALTDSVNAVNRMRGALPGVGAPGSTPTTDLENLNVAAAMDKADLGNRFGFASPEYRQGTETPEIAPTQPSGIDIVAVNERRNQILQGIDPDRPAIFVTPKRQAELNRELAVLTGVAREHAFTTAKQSHQDFLHQKDIDTANQVSEFFKRAKESKTPLGSPEHTQEVLGWASDLPLALGAKEVRDVLKTHLAQHVAASNFAKPPEGYVVDHIVTGNDGKSHAVFKPADKESDLGKDETFKKFGATKDEIAAAVAKNGVESVTKDGKEIGVKVTLPDGRAVQAKREVLAPIINQEIKTGNFTKTAFPEAPATKVPEVGTEKSGYRFKGGNPADKNNWEKIK